MYLHSRKILDSKSQTFDIAMYMVYNHWYTCLLASAHDLSGSKDQRQWHNHRTVEKDGPEGTRELRLLIDVYIVVQDSRYEERQCMDVKSIIVHSGKGGSKYAGNPDWKSLQTVRMCTFHLLKFRSELLGSFPALFQLVQITSWCHIVPSVDPAYGHGHFCMRVVGGSNCCWNRV